MVLESTRLYKQNEGPRVAPFSLLRMHLAFQMVLRCAPKRQLHHGAVQRHRRDHHTDAYHELMDSGDIGKTRTLRRLSDGKRCRRRSMAAQIEVAARHLQSELHRHRQRQQRRQGHHAILGPRSVGVEREQHGHALHLQSQTRQLEQQQRSSVGQEVARSDDEVAVQEALQRVDVAQTPGTR